jgi:hypothetical protein
MPTKKEIGNKYQDGRSIKKYYCNCGRKIHWQTAIKGRGMCQKCYGKIISKRQLGNNNPNYNLEKHKKHYCKDCNKKIKIYFSKRCNTCENKRRHKLGIINSHLTNYKDGRTELRILIWNSIKNKQCRQLVFKRDNYTCKKCNKNKNIYLNSHHKIPITYILDLYNIKTLKQALNCKLLWDINWQITLCEQCHGELNAGKK